MLRAGYAKIYFCTSTLFSFFACSCCCFSYYVVVSMSQSERSNIRHSFGLSNTAIMQPIIKVSEDDDNSSLKLASLGSALSSMNSLPDIVIQPEFTSINVNPVKRQHSASGFRLIDEDENLLVRLKNETNFYIL